MKRRIMLIGKTGSGKTSLANALNNDARPLKKTQDMIFRGETIDVPGAYIETPWMYRYIISAAQNQASRILILADQETGEEICAPGFASVFTCPVTGVVTKADLNPENYGACRAHLERSGAAGPYFRVSAATGAGMGALKAHLFDTLDNKDPEE